MEWPIILAIIIAVPLILLPVAFVWYLNFGGVLARRAQRAKTAEAEKIGVPTK